MLVIGGVNYWEPLLPQLDHLGIEMDQKLRQAWDACASGFVTEVHLLTAMANLNVRGLDCLPWRDHARLPQAVSEFVSEALTELVVGEPPVLPPPCNLLASFAGGLVIPIDISPSCAPHDAEVAASRNLPIWARALQLMGPRRTLSCHHFCRAVADTFLKPWDGPPADMAALVQYLGASFREAPLESHGGEFAELPRILADMPRSRAVVEALGHVPPEPDDFDYALCLEEDRLVVRAVSVLRDGPLELGRSRPDTRALLTHFQRQYGAFTLEEIAELEDLIRNPKAQEREFQAFFEAHPHFFRRWDHREVCPHVYLVREGQGPLVPDFILTNPQVHQATIVELKLPGPKVVRHEDNRVRFADAVMEARAQLLEYRDWFRDRSNRESLVGPLGMEVYDPRMAVIIGRSSVFNPGIERQKVAARTPDVEVVTYDDLAEYARQRIMMIGG